MKFYFFVTGILSSVNIVVSLTFTAYQWAALPKRFVLYTAITHTKKQAPHVLKRFESKMLNDDI